MAESPFNREELEAFALQGLSHRDGLMGVNTSHYIDLVRTALHALQDAEDAHALAEQWYDRVVELEATGNDLLRNVNKPPNDEALCAACDRWRAALKAPQAEEGDRG